MMATFDKAPSFDDEAKLFFPNKWQAIWPLEHNFLLQHPCFLYKMTVLWGMWKHHHRLTDGFSLCNWGNWDPRRWRPTSKVYQIARHPRQWWYEHPANQSKMTQSVPGKSQQKVWQVLTGIEFWKVCLDENPQNGRKWKKTWDQGKPTATKHILEPTNLTVWGKTHQKIKTNKKKSGKKGQKYGEIKTNKHTPNGSPIRFPSSKSFGLISPPGVTVSHGTRYVGDFRSLGNETAATGSAEGWVTGGDEKSELPDFVLA